MKKVVQMDSFNLPKRMNRSQLEWWIIFGICVAGKGAKQTQSKLNALLDDMRNMAENLNTPFDCIRSAIRLKCLDQYLHKYRIGKYKLFSKAFKAVINIDLDNISVATLEKIPGIGPKTARMIILYYEPISNVVPLDTHILKYLRMKGYDTPKSTPPSGKKYLQLEQAFIHEAHKLKMTVRDLDTKVWQQYAKG